jgi:hypothetical protein
VAVNRRASARRAGALDAEQVAYARVLRWGVRLALIALAVTFALYLAGVLRPIVPTNELPGYWGLSAERYAEATGQPLGWGWIAMIGRGDVLPLTGVTLLVGLTIVAYARALPILLRRRDRTYLVIALAEIALLVLAATGVFTAGR